VGGAYTKLAQPASGYSIVGVAAVVGHAHGVLGSTTFDHVRVAITGVGDVAYRAKAVEDALVGTACGQTEIAAAAKHATDGVTVGSDIHADREYRTAMAEVYVRRALEAARARSS
jgi:carbon-monoxide dehydrogenase medium subunit